MKFLWFLAVFVVGASGVLQEKWDAYLQLVNSLFVKENDGIMVTDPPPNYDCDPPYEHSYVFECNPEGKRSKERPKSAHHLMPGDIDVIAAMGDSITAGNGAGACQLPGVAVEYRGISWSIGGDNTLEETLTLTNIFRKYNPNIKGFSYGRGRASSENAQLNVAVPGAVSEDMYDQALSLVSKLKEDETINVGEDWKLVTLFIGGNDLCSACDNIHHYSAEQYVDNIKKAVDYIYNELPRTVVNIISVLNIGELEKLKGTVCDQIHLLVCDCAMFLPPEEKESMALLIHKYQVLSEHLARYYDDRRDDFAVLYQPFFEGTKMPLNEDGSGDESYFSPDCFHFSAKGHALGAKEIWNNMIEPVGEKHTEWDPEGPIYCPDEDYPYIHTYKNTFGLPYDGTPSSSASLKAGIVVTLLTLSMTLLKLMI